MVDSPKLVDVTQKPATTSTYDVHQCHDVAFSPLLAADRFHQISIHNDHHLQELGFVRGSPAPAVLAYPVYGQMAQGDLQLTSSYIRQTPGIHDRT